MATSASGEARPEVTASSRYSHPSGRAAMADEHVTVAEGERHRQALDRRPMLRREERSCQNVEAPFPAVLQLSFVIVGSGEMPERIWEFGKVSVRVGAERFIIPAR